MKPVDDNIVLDIQPASVEDGPIILDLWRQSAKWLQSKGIKQWNPDNFKIEQIAEWLEKGANIYLARLDSEVVGTLLIIWTDPLVWDELNDQDSGYIHRFAVSRQHTGYGIGKLLMDWAENQIRLKGKKIRLDCMADNIRLNQYYQSRGYRLVRGKKWEHFSANLYEKN